MSITQSTNSTIWQNFKNEISENKGHNLKYVYLRILNVSKNANNA